MKLPHVTWLRAFEAAARHNSFTDAANELNITPAAVSQQVRHLEKHLNVSLFERLARGVALTDVGQAYALPIRRSFLDIETATQTLFENRPRRAIRVRANTSFAALILAPKLSAFNALYPDISVELSTAVWADRFGEETLDLDIRYGHGDWPETDVRRLGRDHALIVCHPQHAARFGDAVSAEKIAADHVVQIVGCEVDWLRLAELYGLRIRQPAAWITADSSLIALQTITRCEAATIVLERYAQDYIDSGQVVSPFEYRLPIERAHYLLVRDGAKRRDEVRFFCDWLEDLCV